MPMKGLKQQRTLKAEIRNKHKHSKEGLVNEKCAKTERTKNANKASINKRVTGENVTPGTGKK